MADPLNEAPNAIVWYESPVQRAQVFAAVSSAAAILIPLLGLNVDIAIINAKLALIAQLVNLGFTLWGIVKRRNSPLQPVAWTPAGAEKMAAEFVAKAEVKDETK